MEDKNELLSEKFFVEYMENFALILKKSFQRIEDKMNARFDEIITHDLLE